MQLFDELKVVFIATITGVTICVWVQDSKSEQPCSRVNFHVPDSHILYGSWPYHSLKNERHARFPDDIELPDYAYFLPVRCSLPSNKLAICSLFHMQDRPSHLRR